MDMSFSEEYAQMAAWFPSTPCMLITTAPFSETPKMPTTAYQSSGL
jgi:hypothetical protein